MSMKNSNDTFRNRTSDLPAYSAVPQPAGPPRTPHLLLTLSLQHVSALKGPSSGSMTVTFQRQGRRSDVKFNLLLKMALGGPKHVRVT